MSANYDEVDQEATAEQLELLRRLGVPELDIEDLSMAQAEELIAQVRAQREAAGRFSGD